MTFSGTSDHGVTLSSAQGDPLQERTSPDEISQRGGNVLRHRRLMVAFGTPVIAVAAAGLAITLLSGTTSPSRPATVSPLRLLAASSAYQLHTPGGTPVMVDHSVPGWRSFAWLSVDGQFCSGTLGVTPQNQAVEAVGCIKPVGFGKPNKSGPPDKFYAAATVPEFQVLPPARDRALVIGLARHDVASIEITFLGEHVAAKVFRIPYGAKDAAYAAWLPLHGRTSYGTNDITAFIVRNKSGEVLTS
jgi:hypothetical protein